jgi:hypothetical protein
LRTTEENKGQLISYGEPEKLYFDIYIDAPEGFDINNKSNEGVQPNVILKFLYKTDDGAYQSALCDYS